MNPLYYRGGEHRNRGVAEMTLSEALYEFTERYLFMRGFSKSTIDNYRWAVTSFIDTVGDIRLSDITVEHIVQWKHMAHSNQWDNNSIAAYMYRIRLFLKYWIKHANLSLDLDDILIPKRQSKLPKYLTLEQAKSVFNSCQNARERAFVSLLFSTGIRVSEACKIRVKDIRSDSILIRGKAGKERVVFLDPLTSKCIQAYIQSRNNNSEYLFSGYGQTMSKSTIQKCMREIGQRAGINGLTPHVFRHTYATLLLNNGCSLRHIQKLLGHADISTTQIYTHVSNKELAGSYKQYHVALS